MARSRLPCHIRGMSTVREQDYQTLASFRFELRRFVHFSEAAAAAAGLTSQQHQTLLAIRASPDGVMLVGELAGRLLLRPHSASELAARLEKAGLVCRVPGDGDRRQARIALSDKGGALLESLSSMHREELRRIRPLLARLLAEL